MTEERIAKLVQHGQGAGTTREGRSKSDNGVGRLKIDRSFSGLPPNTFVDDVLIAAGPSAPNRTGLENRGLGAYTFRFLSPVSSRRMT